MPSKLFGFSWLAQGYWDQLTSIRPELPGSLRVNRPYRRARLACLECRRRKVGYNVELCGRSCTNCLLDDSTCITRTRKGNMSPTSNHTTFIADVISSRDDCPSVGLESRQNKNESRSCIEVSMVLMMMTMC